MRRWLRYLAVAITAATVVLGVAAVVMLVVAESRGVPRPSEAWAGLLLLLAGLAPACVGLLVALRRPDARVAWILIGGAFSVALVITADTVAGLALYEDPESAVGRWATVVGEEWPVLFVWPLALAYVFPDGRLPSPRWRPVAVLAAVSAIGVMVLIFLAPELEGPYGTVPTPLPFELDEGTFLPVFWTCWVGLLLSLFGGAAAMRARYRAGGPDQRRQVLWLAYGALLVPLWLGGGWLLSWLIGPAFYVLDGIALVTFQVWPAVAVAVAVTRHGLYSIDRLFNRTVVYALLTALLAGTYAVVALVVGMLAGGSALSASVATLAAALAFRPLRDAVQTIVDRRFARARFDAVRLMRGFLDDVRDGRAEPEDVGAVMRLALGDPTAEVLFRLPETGAYADHRGRLHDELPGDERARSAIGRASSGSSCTPPPWPAGRTCCTPSSMPPRCRWSSRGCGSSCGCSSPRSSPRARGSRRPAMPSGGGSSATCTTGPSSGWSRWGSSCGGCSARFPARRGCSGPRSTRRSTRSRGRSRTCARSRPASARRASTRGWRPRSPTSRAAPASPSR